MIRLSKDSALRFARRWTPLYAELFNQFKLEGGRVQIASRYTQIRTAIGSYVLLYDDERKAGFALLRAFLGEDGLKELYEEADQLNEDERREFIEEWASDEVADAFANSFDLPQTEEDWKRATEKFNALSEDEQKAAIERDSFFWSGFFAQFFNTLSLMTHGARLTTLVPQAISGDSGAFLKAVQIDRLLLQHHPYFVQRKQQAQDDGDQDFLAALAYRESNPNLRGRIRYPGLYMLFGILQVVGWLDDLQHSEILDLCDEIGLDRFQNRIEDVGYVTKRLLEYRHFQKTGGVSMH